jgi:hypothetical protein
VRSAGARRRQQRRAAAGRPGPGVPAPSAVGRAAGRRRLRRRAPTGSGAAAGAARARRGRGRQEEQRAMRGRAVAPARHAAAAPPGRAAEEHVGCAPPTPAERRSRRRGRASQRNASLRLFSLSRAGQAGYRGQPKCATTTRARCAFAKRQKLVRGRGRVEAQKPKFTSVETQRAARAQQGPRKGERRCSTLPTPSSLDLVVTELVKRTHHPPQGEQVSVFLPRSYPLP